MSHCYARRHVVSSAPRTPHPDIVITSDTVERLRSRYDHCFACGRTNPIGLGLDGFAVCGDEVAVSFSPRPEYAGFEDLLHGGIVATALDEVLAWTGILIEGVLAVTATLELKYRRPASPDADFVVVGRVDDRSGSRLRMSGEMREGAELVAEGKGLYLVHLDLQGP